MRIEILCVVVGLCLAAVAVAEESESSEVNTGQDITRPLTRFDIRFDTKKLNGDSTSYTTTLRMDKPIPLGEDGEDGIFQVRMDLPIVYSDAVGRDNPNGDYEWGAGDYLTQFLYIPPFSVSDDLPWDAFGFGVQLIWPTASKDMMGNEQYVIEPIFAMKFDMSDKWGKGAFVLPVLGYFTDYGNYSGGKDRDNIGEFSIRPSIYIPMPKECSLPFDFVNFWANNEIFINVEDGETKSSGDVFIPFDVMFGKMINDSTILSLDFASPLYKSKGYDRYDWIMQCRVGFFF